MTQTGSATTAAYADSAGSAATADLATTSEDAEVLGGQPADHYMTADSVLQPGQTLAGDFFAAAGNNLAGTVLVQFWPHLPESVPPGHTIVMGRRRGDGPMPWCRPGGGRQHVRLSVIQRRHEL